MTTLIDTCSTVKGSAMPWFFLTAHNQSRVASVSIFCCLVAISAAMGCSAPEATTPSSLAIDPIVESGLDLAAVGTSNGGECELTVDLATLEATVTPVAERRGSKDTLFFYPGNALGLKLSDVQVSSLGSDTLKIDYSVRHPFQAPIDPALPASANNRADLAVSGRVLFLIHAPTNLRGNPIYENYIGNYRFTLDGHTEYIDPTVVLNADGYCDPTNMLGTDPEDGNTAYPFKALCNDGVPDSRTDTFDGQPIPRGATSEGDWRALTGWSSTAGVSPHHIAFTGYGLLHQGQAARNSLLVHLEPGQAHMTFRVLIAINRTDPRNGTNSGEYRSNRLPKNDPAKFAYHAAHGAVDLESVSFTPSPGTLGTAAGSTHTATLRIVDMDAKAPLGSSWADVPYPSGIASVTVITPELGDQDAVSVVPTGTGLSESPLTLNNLVITNTLGASGGFDNGTYVFVRVIDEQDLAPDGDGKGFSAGPATSDDYEGQFHLRPIVFQAFWLPMS
ncbi:MAG: hypothetical protein ABI743_03745 [bacterium]